MSYIVFFFCFGKKRHIYIYIVTYIYIYLFIYLFIYIFIYLYINIYIYIYLFIYLYMYLGVRGLSEFIIWLAMVCHGRCSVLICFRPHFAASILLVGLEHMFS